MSERTGWGDICNRVETCAITGAGAFTAGIPGSEILVNGPLWCYFYALRYLEHVDYSLAERFHGSQPDNNAIVYGSEPYVTEALENLLATGRRPSLLLLESSCSLSLIGDDLAGIVYSLHLPFPVVTMDCGGIIGGFAAGYSRAAVKIFKALLPKTSAVVPRTVNILGVTDFYLHGAEDRKELVRLLRLAGCERIYTPGSGATLEELQQLGTAELNIVTNEELGLPLAQFLQKQYGTSYVLAGVPYGVKGTLRWLRRLQELLPWLELGAVEKEAAAISNFLLHRNNEIRGLWGRLWFDEVVVSAPATTALCLAQILRTEWADTGRLSVICQQPLQEQHYCDQADAIYTVGVDDAKIAGLLESCDKLLLLGSSSESSVLYRRGKCDFTVCSIAYPANDEALFLEEPTAGLRGSLYLLQRLWSCLINQKLRRIGGR